MSKPDKPHAIEEIRFSGVNCSITCRCDWFYGPDTPAGIHLAYQAHRKDMGLNATSQSDMGHTGAGSQAFVVRPR